MFLSCIYTCVVVGDSIFKRGVGIPLTGLTPPCCCVCPKPGPGFPAPNIVVVLMFNVLRRQMVVGFVDIDGTFDHHYLSFHFIIVSIKML